MAKVTAQLVTGPLVGLAVGVGDGVVGQAQFGDRHDNVRSIYRLGVLAVGAIAVACSKTPWRVDAGIGAMTGAAALVGSRVVPALQGGGWQQFGYVEADPRSPRQPVHRPRDSVIDLEPEPEPGDAVWVPATDAPGQVPGPSSSRWRGHAKAYAVQQAPGIL